MSNEGRSLRAYPESEPSAAQRQRWFPLGSRRRAEGQGQGVFAEPPAQAGLSMTLRQFSRRTLCGAAAGLVAAGLATRLGWMAANLQTSAPTPAASHGSQAVFAEQTPKQAQRTTSPEMRVTGPSMSPTLLGTHAQLTCDACRVAWLANWQPEFRPAAPVICWNCGARVSIDSAVARPGSLVRIEPLAPDQPPPAVGDLIAIDFPPNRSDTQGFQGRGDDPLSAAGQVISPSLSVKRIVAGPGQTITHRHGQLLVDGDPILPDTLWIPVHDDSHRREGHSWWQLHPSGAAENVQITRLGFKLSATAATADDAAPGVGDWLVYHHRSVHNAMRPDRVRDDIPGNVTEVRSLLPVARLRLSLRVESHWSGVLEIAFWNRAEPLVYRYALPSDAGELQIEGPCIGDTTAAAEPGEDGRIAEPPTQVLSERGLSEISPIAIRLISGTAELSQLRIDRPLQYLIDNRLAATLAWPIALGADQYFVLGDNVPLSIDSRHFGPIDRSGIVGRIRPVSYDGPGRLQ